MEREKFLALTRKPHIDAALQFVGVKRMRRLAKLQHHEIRDVDDVVDRANADALNFRAQPLRGGTWFYVVDLAQREEWTFAGCRNFYAVIPSKVEGSRGFILGFSAGFLDSALLRSE